MKPNLAPFMDPAMVASYSNDTASKVPGLADLHQMATLLLSECAPGAAEILVVGAGGGLELAAMAQARTEWRFTGVDPSPVMVDLARDNVRLYADRMEFVVGTIDDCSRLSFDGATCLLTLHFLTRSERLHTLKEIHLRLKPGSGLVIAHHTAPYGDARKWLARSIGFANRGSSANARNSAETMADRLPLLSIGEEEDLLIEAGFVLPELFYAALSFRGWVAIAG